MEIVLQSLNECMRQAGEARSFGNPRNAAKHYRNVLVMLQRGPEMIISATQGLAEMLEAQNMYGEALWELETLLKNEDVRLTGDQRTTFTYRCGLYLRLTGDYDKAETILKQALEMAGNNPRARRQRGAIFCQLSKCDYERGHTSMAQAHCNQAMREFIIDARDGSLEALEFYLWGALLSSYMRSPKDVDRWLNLAGPLVSRDLGSDWHRERFDLVCRLSHDPEALRLEIHLQATV